MVVLESLSVEKKLAILSDAAKYDVACTSSGMQRQGKPGELGNSEAAGICHSFSADGRCISLLKILYTNECIFDCKYCLNRSSNDVCRTSFTPRELCELTVGFYKRNYIEGLFLSSGITRTPDHTMNEIVQTLRMLREEYHFRGYIHCKAIPGASPELIEAAGWYADRMSVNLELPTNEGLRKLAPNKTRKNILTPMRQIQNGISESRALLGFMGGNESAYNITRKRAAQAGVGERFRGKLTAEDGAVAKSPVREDVERIGSFDRIGSLEQTGGVGRTGKVEPAQTVALPKQARAEISEKRIGSGQAGLMLRKEIGGRDGRGFAAAGQSTQMIIGATPETDFHLISVTEALYRNFDLKRVFFSAFVNVNRDSTLPDLPKDASLLREHRLYQADWLMRFYGFAAGELLSEKRPNFNPVLDPKCNWAVQHLEFFPVEVCTADYFLLLRVPGIGPKSAQRIIEARKNGSLSFETLKKIGVVLKRAYYFITCGGKTLGKPYLDEYYITQSLALGERLPKNLSEVVNGRQISLFEYFSAENSA